MRLARGALAAGLLAGLWVLATPLVAGAHALVRSSDPANGAILSRPPAQVLITFTEAPDQVLSIIHVLSSSGQAVESGTAQAVPGRPLELRVPLPSLPDGAYTVSWRTVSRVDGHVTGGAFTFGIGVPAGTPIGPSGAASPSTPSPSPLAVAGRWAFYWGVALLVGAGAVGTVVVRTVSPGHRWLLAGAWLLAAAGLAGMTLAERSAVGVGLGALLSSDAGKELVDRGVALAIAGGMLVTAILRPRWESLLFVGIAGCVVLWAHAVAGHAGGESPVLFNVGVQWIHLVAIGAWVGGLAWLVLAVRGAESPERRAAVARFSRLAGYALAVTVASGVLRAVAELGGWRHLFDTSFGTALLVKGAIVAGLIALGAVNRYANVPAVGSGPGALGRLRRTVSGELVLAAGILAAAAVLSELPPATFVAAAGGPTAPASVVVSGSDFATTVRVTLTVTPGMAGPNRFTARVLDFDTHAPVPAQRVDLRFALPSRPDVGASTLDLRRGSNGLWSATSSALSIDGRWSVDVTVQEAAGGVDVPLRLQTRLQPEQISVVKGGPGQPDLYTIALANGETLQTYVDPGSLGTNNVHFTFFQASGNELPIASATATAAPPAGDQRALRLVRFDAGHFVGTLPLTSGRWTFRVIATTAGGRSVTGYFSQRIGTTGG